MNPHGSFIWYELMTRDSAAAAKFYGDVVGWTVGESMPGPVEYSMLTAPDGHVGGLLKLTDEMCDGGAYPGWFGYFGADDVDASTARVADAGGRVQMEPHDIPGVGRMSMVSDPQGVPFYIMRGASPESSTAYGRHATGHVSWNELMAPDDAAAIKFYDDIFDVKTAGSMPMGEMGDYTFITNTESEGEAIGAIMRTPPGAKSGWSFYFRVPDITSARARVEAGGGTVLQDPMEVPGGEWVLNAIDPEGVHFGLVAPNKES